MSFLDDYAEGIAAAGVLLVVVGAGGQLTAATSQAPLLFQRLNTAAMGLGLAIAVVGFQFEGVADGGDGDEPESPTATCGYAAVAVGLFLIAVAPFGVAPFRLTALAGGLLFVVGVGLVATFEGFDDPSREGYSVPDDPTEVLDE